MTAQHIEVTSLTELRLASGVCDACETEGWVILVVINKDDPIAFYLCDEDRRKLIERLCAI